MKILQEKFSSTYKLTILVATCLLTLIMFLSCGGGDDVIPIATQEPAVDMNIPNIPTIPYKILNDSTDDFPQMLNRRAIRVLVTYNSTNFFITSEAKYQGLEYEQMHNFEKFLNNGIREANKKVNIVFYAVPFNSLIPLLQEGKGDIIAAGITVAPQSEEQVKFTNPYITNVDEIVVRSKDADPVESIQDLSDRDVHVLSGSSYAVHLRRINEELASRGLEKINVIECDPAMEEEDIFNLMNLGSYRYTVADGHIARLWEKILDNIIVEENAVVNGGGEVAWAVRKNNPLLLEKLNEYVQTSEQGTLLGNMLLNRYYFKRTEVNSPFSEHNRQQLDKYIGYFKKYGEQYDFDWLFLGALGFQESKLNQSIKSSAGAVGIMQIKPGTAADKNVGITGVEDSAENNIHAGTKYLNFLRERYFSSPEIDDLNKIHFTIAAYNAGPARINSLRKLASEAGLDPNKWFNNVEKLAAEDVGNETVEYVTNIHRYYIAYKTIQETMQKKRELLQ